MFAAPKTDTEVQKIIADGVSVKTQAYTKYCIRIWNEWVENRVDEQLVTSMERTGHRSIDGIRSYKRTADFQRENISDILNCNASKRVGTVSMPLPMVSKHPNAMKNIVPGTYNFHSCACKRNF